MQSVHFVWKQLFPSRGPPESITRFKQNKTKKLFAQTTEECSLRAQDRGTLNETEAGKANTGSMIK